LIETILLLPSLIFAVLVIFLARPLGISLVLLRTHISQRARLFIGYVRGLVIGRGIGRVRLAEAPPEVRSALLSSRPQSGWGRWPA
jgi:NhaP-type Na+/H+ and K+/H+ antiporter